MSGVKEGRGVSGLAALPGTTFDPVKDGYPASDPTTGFQAQDEWFAGIILGAPASGGPALRLYCIDLHTETTNGYGYALGEWSSAAVPNVGYVARVLSEYYPNTSEPAGLATIDEKAAATQAAVWFFTDRYVLKASDPLHDAVAAIVAAVIKEGPITEPPPPSLTITPTSSTGQAGRPVGPFTLNSSVDAIVTATGAAIYADASGSKPIANGATVPPGTQIWLQSPTAGTGMVSAIATATVPSGNVYLYSGNNPNVTSAQKLILAQSATLTTRVSASAQFQAFGALEVKKVIAGGAGRQGPITIAVSCDKNTPKLEDFTIPARSPAGTVTHAYSNIAAGAVCTVTENVDGSTDTTVVNVSGSGSSVTIPADEMVAATITDTYTRAAPGSLVVEKSITGPSAGQQGPVRIHVVCDETPDSQTPDFTIDAGATGTVSHTYENIPAGAVCTVSEFANGTTRTVEVTVAGSPQTVTVPAGAQRTVELTDSYSPTPGSLTVLKTITGEAAGRQGEVRIAVDCGNGSPKLDDFVIPAMTGAGTQTKTYTGIPAGAVCTATETSDGHTATVTVDVQGNGRTTTIRPADTATLDVSDFYVDVPGELVVVKSITGPAADMHGPITIVPTCDGVSLPPFEIPVGATGTPSRTYHAIAAGSSCTVTETVDGHTSTVAVAVTGSGQEVKIQSNASAAATLTDIYTDAPGTLVVNKTIAGTAAGKQGEITIAVTCGGTQLENFVIAAGAPAGTTSKTYTGLPAAATCTLSEPEDGHTPTVNVRTDGGQQVAVPAGGAGTAGLIDTYTEVPGSLVVRKTIAGPAAGRQGRIVIVPTCDGSELDPFVIPPGASAGALTKTYDGIPVGATCSLAETADGHTDTVELQSKAGASVTVPTGRSVTASLTDTYADVEGSLLVVKSITGAATGSQGRVKIAVSCDHGAPALPNFDIPAGADDGTVTRTYGGLPAGAACTVHETADGGTSTVTAVVVGGSRAVTIAAGDTTAVRLADTYAFKLPDLVVEKNVPGETPSGTDYNVNVIVGNKDDITAKKVTVCVRLDESQAFVVPPHAHLVHDGACWRVVQIRSNKRHSVEAATRAFARNGKIRACTRITVEVRGVDARTASACTTVAGVRISKGGGVTG